MKINVNLNGTSTDIPAGKKLYYRASSNGQYTQIKNVYYRESSDAYTQVYQYDATPPNITINSASGTVTSTSYTLTATITDSESGIGSVTINGVNYPITSGAQTVNVSKAYTLGAGYTTFTIVATDTAGNSSTSSKTVMYKNTSVITWSDTLTGSAWGSTGYSGGISYSGDRNGNTGGCSNYLYQISYGEQNLGVFCRAYANIRGRIFSGTKSLTVGHSCDGNYGGSFYCHILNSAGTVVANLGDGTHNISAYGDGSYYLDMYSDATNYSDTMSMARAGLNSKFST